jgi:hypothetical protein
MGSIGLARCQAWRGNVDTLVESSDQTLQRVSQTAGPVFRFIGIVQAAGKIDRELFERLVSQPHSPDLPVRQMLVRLQIFSEIALVLGDVELGVKALARATELGLLDLTWIDHCPLLERAVSHARYPELRRQIALRADRVLNAFHGATTA